jgi:hypothetical protein
MSSEPIFAPTPIERQGTENKILDFNRYRGNRGATAASTIAGILLSDPTFQQNLKEIVEGIVFRSMFENYSETLSSVPDPFDSLLIIDLKPDAINVKDISTLEGLSSQIEDRSDEVSFLDNLE